MSDIVFTDFTHAEMVDGVETIARAIEADAWAPDLLVGIGRGGLAPGVYLSHRLDLPLVSVDHSARIAQFGDELVGVLAERSRGGDRLLFVEDINDSGRTLGEIRAALATRDADPANLRFAVLLDNLRSSQQVDYRFRAIDRSVTRDWFVFPWEAMAPRARLADEAREVPERIG